MPEYADSTGDVAVQSVLRNSLSIEEGWIEEGLSTARVIPIAHAKHAVLSPMGAT